MSAAIANQYARTGAQRRIGVNNRTGETAVELRIGFAGIELAQHHLAVCPGQLEHAIRETAIMIFLDQTQYRSPGIGDARDHIDRRRSARVERHSTADRGDRVQHRALGARERSLIDHCNEPHAVGLERNLAAFRPVHGHQMKHPRYLLFGGAWTAGAQDRPAPADDFRLHEQIAEGRMQRVRRGRCEHDLSVAGELNGVRIPRSIGDVNPPQFDVIFGGHHDLGMRFEVEVAAAKFRSPFGEDRFVMFRLLERGLIRGRPEFPTLHLAQVAKAAPVVASAILAPAGDRQVFPATAPAPGVGDHHVVAAVGQQLHFRNRRVRVYQHAYRQLGAALGQAKIGDVRRMRIKWRSSGNAFLQQQQSRLK